MAVNTKRAAKTIENSSALPFALMLDSTVIEDGDVRGATRSL